jgi:hypothetical protein
MLSDLIIAYKQPGTENVCYIYPKPGQDLEILAKESVPAGTDYWFTTNPQTDINDPIQSLVPNLSRRFGMGFMENGVLRHQLGYFGNIWIRQNFIQRAGEFSPGHTHNFDHVSLLVSGSVRVEVDGYEPKEFVAPTFIMVKKDYKHKFTALEDNTLWYCVFALRDVDGEVSDIYDGNNWPYSSASNGNIANLRKSTENEN